MGSLDGGFAEFIEVDAFLEIDFVVVVFVVDWREASWEFLSGSFDWCGGTELSVTSDSMTSCVSILLMLTRFRFVRGRHSFGLSLVC